jgi:SAM-dependent methyltransferase
MALLERVVTAWNRHGVISFLGLLVKNIIHPLKRIAYGEFFFDRVHGANTDGIIQVADLNVNTENAKHSAHYEPTRQRLAKQIINGLPIQHNHFTFLDFGAGKGRVLLIAAKLPFIAVIGIEFSRDLCSVATENIARIAAKNRRAARIECHYGDATAYPLPDSPMVCYFYNPFDEVLMQVMVDRLAESLRNNPRDIYVVYVNPLHRVLFDADRTWNVIQEGKNHVTYRAQIQGHNSASLGTS